MTDVIAREDAALVADLYDGARRFAGVVAPWDMDPDDVLHAALVNILRKGRLANADSPLAYVRRAVVNEVRSEIRRKQTRRRTVLRWRNSVAESEASDYPSDLGDLMQLKPTERAVLYLHDIEGLPFDEVAEAVGISAGNARVTASRARGRLRQLLTEESAR